jgi:acyl-coenzyme A thioesterase 13
MKAFVLLHQQSSAKHEDVFASSPPAHMSLAWRPTSFSLSLPKSPYGDASKTPGNAPVDIKQLSLNIFHHFVTRSNNLYAVAIAERIRFVDISLEKKDGVGPEARTTCEINVTEGALSASLAWFRWIKLFGFLLDMCNTYGVMHGGCAAFLVDPLVLLHASSSRFYWVWLSCSVSAILLLGLHLGLDGCGLSQSLNIIYHQPAKLLNSRPVYSVIC